MKKILFVLPFLPYPMTSGGAQAIFNGIDVVKDELDVYVTFESNSTGKEIVEKFKLLLDNKVKMLPYYLPVREDKKPSLRQRFYRVFFKIEKKLRRLSGYDFTPVRIPHRSWLYEELSPKRMGFAKHVCNLVDEYQIDIVQCEMLRNVTLGLMLPERVRKVFVHHELGWIVHGLELMQQKGDPFEQKIYLEHYKRCEIGLLNAFDDVITLSSLDTDKLLQAGVTANIHTSLAVVNTSHDRMLSTRNSNVLSFVGPDCNLPNVAGLKWFLNNVWKELLQKDPSYELQIIGRWSPEHVSELFGGREHIKYLGFVEDMTSVLKDTVMIVPITVGSGIRMKILEAASMGVPFVTTSVGVEGIPVENDVHCLVADTPECFCDAVLKLQDSVLRARLATNANRLVSEHFTLDALRSNRLNIYSQM